MRVYMVYKGLYFFTRKGDIIDLFERKLSTLINHINPHQPYETASFMKFIPTASYSTTLKVVRRLV